MTDDQEAAWRSTLVRFREAWGSEFDPADETDRGLFLEMLEEEVHRRISERLVHTFREATARLRASDEVAP